MGSKNNPAARGQAGGIKKVKGKTVKPVKYIGKYAGHGNYIAAMFETGELLMSSNKPIPFSDVIPDPVDPAAAAKEAEAKAKKNAKK